MSKSNRVRLKPTKGWAAADRNGRVDMFTASPTEFNKAISRPVIVHDLDDHTETQARLRRLESQNKRMRAELARKKVK